MKPIHINSGSFRDPAGFIYEKEGIIFRQVNKCYSEDFEALQSSGLLNSLQKHGYLINHQNVDLCQNTFDSGAYRIIQPERIPYISYPFEWSFSQLKDAALLTLEIQKESLIYGFVLKDANAYNIQFLRGKPVFIDTLSFEKYKEGDPWVAYGQYCRHFLASLALMSYSDICLNQLLKIHLDGIPLPLTTRLLPFSAFINIGLFMHLRVHANAISHIARKYELHVSKSTLMSQPSISKNGLFGIIDSLKRTISNLRWEPKTPWIKYYENTNYTENSFKEKKRVVETTMRTVRPKIVWDFGSNIGEFSRIVSKFNAQVIAFDMDPGAVEQNYAFCKEVNEINVLPLLMDFTNPTPGLGWCNNERLSFTQRGSADLILALAIIHHLAIGNNLPLSMIANFFSQRCRYLLIEFVPKTDSQVQRMLRIRRDIFSDYSEEGFLTSFLAFFSVEYRMQLVDSDRILFLMQNKANL